MSLAEGQKRYEVQYPTGALDYPGVSNPGTFDDLEDAGRCYLSVPGATDIYDRLERRYVNPEQEIDCVAEAFEAWLAGRGAPRDGQSA